MILPSLHFTTIYFLLPSNRREYMPDYAVWEINPMMKSAAKCVIGKFEHLLGERLVR
jgi:hypothetical protein